MILNVNRRWQKCKSILAARYYLRRATSIGVNARIEGKPFILNQGQLVIGDHLLLRSTIATTELVVGENGKMEIGDQVFINYGCSISANLLVQIGNHCSLGPHCILLDNDFHSVEVHKRNHIPASRPIVLEERVWLGARVILLKGVHIGRNSVIGAGSVVTHDVPPDCLAAGNPARIIRNIQASESIH